MFDKHAAALAALRAAELQTGVTPVVDIEQGTAAHISPGSVVVVPAARMYMWHLLNASAPPGTWVAVVGAADFGVAAVAEAGLALERVALIPAPGAEAAVVCAALLEAMWVVVGRDVAMLDSEKRRLAARARERGTVIFSELPWPGAHLNFQVQARSWAGANQGEGWLQRCRLGLTRAGRGAAAQAQTVEVELP